MNDLPVEPGRRCSTQVAREVPLNSLRTGAMLLAALCVLHAGSARAACDATGIPPGIEIAELATPLGSVCIELLRDAASLHVDNFLHYLENEAMVGTFFHRSIPGFIVQGGGFALGASDYEAIPATNGAVPNEPCMLDTPDPLNPSGQICSQRGTERGTLALAKLGGDPNSGTTNWFINLADNRSNLDNQNGGFSVFGKVIGTGMTTVDAMAALPTASQDDLAWMESAFQTSPSFPIPLLQAPLDSSADAVGCWNPALQVTALDDTLLPTLAGLGPDPANATLPFETLSTFCATPFANDPATFVGNPTPGIPGGCPFDLLAVATTGPRSLGLVGATPSFWTLSCASQQQALADRAAWQAGFQTYFNQQLVTIDSAIIHTTAVPMLPLLARGLLAAALLGAARAQLARSRHAGNRSSRP